MRLFTPGIIGTLRYGPNTKKYMSWDQSLFRWGGMMEPYWLGSNPSHIYPEMEWGNRFPMAEDSRFPQAVLK